MELILTRGSVVHGTGGDSRGMHNISATPIATRLATLYNYCCIGIRHEVGTAYTYTSGPLIRNQDDVGLRLDFILQKGCVLH